MNLVDKNSKTGKFWILFFTIVFTTTWGITETKKISQNELEALYQDALKSIETGIQFFHSIAIRGGYVYYYTLDLKEKWGEGKTDDYTIEVQPPGTPAVGMAFLKAYQVTGNENFLEAAKDAANALIWGQNDLGGWEHKIYFNRPKNRRVSFDDNQTQSAIRFLMALDQVVDDTSLDEAITKALNLMLTSQFENGAWPHQYPEQGNYHDFATFNDGCINNCIQVMMDAYRYYQKDEYLESIYKAARFLMISQLPPPQPGWAQQYNEYLQPAWARSFEPPAVCPLVTLRNVNTLIDLYLYTGKGQYLEPVPDALRWVRESRLPNGKWARFVELGTNKPLYYDRGRIRVNSVDELHIERRTGYGYETDLSEMLNQCEERFEKVKKMGREAFLKAEKKQPSSEEIQEHLRQLVPKVKQIIETQDEKGRWVIKNDCFKKIVPGVRWNGEYEIKDRISSKLFIKNIETLCDFIEWYQKQK